ncbi:MAG: KH domain-containing protein, partial [Pseudarthrobacter sp.]
KRGIILDHMAETISGPRKEMSRYAPRIETIRVAPDKIGLIIGPGGKTIKGIVAETGAEINIDDDGSVHIYSSNGEALARAKEIINGMTKEISIGEVYQGTVVSIKEFGAFVEVLPGKDGLVHISELADFRVNKVQDVVQMGLDDVRGGRVHKAGTGQDGRQSRRGGQGPQARVTQGPVRSHSAAPSIGATPAGAPATASW